MAGLGPSQFRSGRAIPLSVSLRKTEWGPNSSLHGLFGARGLLVAAIVPVFWTYKGRRTTVKRGRDR